MSIFICLNCASGFTRHCAGSGCVAGEVLELRKYKEETQKLLKDHLRCDENMQAMIVRKDYHAEERHRLQQNLAEIRELIGARGRNQDYTMDRLKKIMAVVKSIPPETIENRLNCRACFDTENWPCSQCDMHYAIKELDKL